VIGFHQWWKKHYEEYAKLPPRQLALEGWIAGRVPGLVLAKTVKRLEAENDELRAECTRLYGECNELEPVED
jgi:hypothetical protein